MLRNEILMKMKKIVVFWFIFTLVNFALALLSLQVRDVWSLSSLVWFPAGLLQGIFCARAPRYWPAWLITGALISLTASQWYGRPVNVSLIFSCINVVMLVVTGLIWQFFYGAMWAPKRARDIFSLIILCSLSGIIERFMAKWVLHLLDYPTDISISLLLVVGSVLSYLPFTFFIISFITHEKNRTGDRRVYGLCLVALFVMAILFTSPPPETGKIHWQGIALMFSFSLPMLLALSGDLLVLSSFLSLCTLGVVSATIFGFGPFSFPLMNLQQNVQMAAWYSTAFTLPALLCCSCLYKTINALHRRKARFLLLSAMLEQEQINCFRLSADGHLYWHHDAAWMRCGKAPAYWSQLMAWVHKEDRQKIEQLKSSVSLIPQVLKVRIADGKGEFNQVIIALIIHVGENAGFIEGTMREIADKK
ncbi:hypothetical transmembrane secreted protein [Photorhabdus asymbiotica]|uniref:Integral membrane sensor domain MASE1 n=3 Tax=Morganellaceae TaxID=1903414 RepID=A0ABX9SQN4_9GAMM|nr:integral membrane sensor domain MASE1 [Photorhabdus asymbiotica]CAQ84359.1 hypothetical transmembrane secreted protein [Photorhabdus asymbiotica]CAR66816.1 hypothetical transmembrane secreted protein [Photorhabdus asymbiotica subsp. asymbiotica ATCC 43949]